MKTSSGANLGFEAKLWEAANKLRGHLDAADYKHVVLGLIFLMPSRKFTKNLKKSRKSRNRICCSQFPTKTAMLSEK